jgi:valyl-tRNA synthetase
MIMAGFEYMHEKPFSEVYFTGIVRDELGRKMSKQLGNSPDLLALIDKYGADAVRFGIIISSPAGNDLLFDVKEETTLKQGSFFINKIWNALRLVRMWEDKIASSQTAVSDQQSAINSQLSSNFALEWFENRLNEVKTEIDDLYREFKLSEILKTIYSLIWDDFCSWYLEWVKPGFEETIEGHICKKTVEFFEQLMHLLHPFMPFVTEEVYHQLRERKEGDDLTIKRLPEIRNPHLNDSVGQAKSEILKQGELLKEVITGIRDARNKNQIKPKDKISINIQTAVASVYQRIQTILQKQVNADSIRYVDSSLSNTINIVLAKDKFYIETPNATNTNNQKQQLQKDLNYMEGFLTSVEKKLTNERFIQNARPEVIETERKKKADAEAKIKALKEQLQTLD